MARLINWWRVHNRINHLEYMSTRGGQVEMAWRYELSYIRRTGKLDWVNPNPIRVRPAGSTIKPIPRS